MSEYMKSRGTWWETVVFGWGEPVTEMIKQPRGTLRECGVLGGEHRLYNSESSLNCGALPPVPPFRWGFAPMGPHPLFLILLF